MIRFALVFAGDDACGPALAVAMHSALVHLAPAARLELYVLDSGLSEPSRRRLERVVGSTRLVGGIRWFQAPTQSLGPIATGSHLTPTSYARLLIAELVPQHVQRAVYLDADVLVQRDISPLFTIDLGGAAIGAVRDLAITTTAHPLSGVRERARAKPYFNAGVLSIDTARWRDEGITGRALRYASAGEPLRFADQDALNGLGVDWHELDLRWNVQQHRRRNLFVERSVFAGHRVSAPEISKLDTDLHRRYGDLDRAAWVLHFVGGLKPWQDNCLTPGTAAWERSLLRTRWYTPGEALAWLMRRHGKRLRYRIGTAKLEAQQAVRDHAARAR